MSRTEQRKNIQCWNLPNSPHIWTWFLRFLVLSYHYLKFQHQNTSKNLMINSRVGLKVNTGVSHRRKVIDRIIFHLQGLFNKASHWLIFGNVMHVKWKLDGMYCVRHINQSQWPGVWEAGTVCLTLKLIIMAGDR